MVSLVREHGNRYDPNAVKVNNVNGIQVGHIKRELAKPLANILDRRLARVEGSVNLLSVLLFCKYNHKAFIHIWMCLICGVSVNMREFPSPAVDST